jgi:hypothetical protein
MIYFSISSWSEPVHLEKARLLALLDYAILHPHSHQWIGPLTLLLAWKGGMDG